MNESNGTTTLPPFEKRLYLGQCPHCLRTTLSYDATLDSIQCEGCGALWDRRNIASGDVGVYTPPKGLNTANNALCVKKDGKETL